MERSECHKCGSDMTYRGKSEPRSNGHHASVFYCPDCDATRLRG